MKPELTITSLTNPHVKTLVRLRKHRDEMILLEGQREIQRALQYGLKLESLYVDPTIASADVIASMNQNIRCFNLARNVYEKVAMREGTEGLLALAKRPLRNLAWLESQPKPTQPIYLVLDQVEKPGNLGAILRTAAACGVHAILQTGVQSPDAFSPQVIRASIGTTFAIPVIHAGYTDVLTFLHTQNIQIFGAILQGNSTSLHKMSGSIFTKPTAVVMGSEAGGVADFWKKNVDHPVVIPMEPLVDSLNVSVACALLCYEVYRARL